MGILPGATVIQLAGTSNANRHHRQLPESSLAAPMCTVSWQYRAGGYQLFCNHDESLSRKAALPPELEAFAGARFLAPRDTGRAGTWIAVNEFGITVCLLKGGPAHGGVRATQSRGWLVADLARLRSTAEMAAYLEYSPLYDYSSFTVAILAPREAVLLLEWNGVTKHSERRAGRGMISSSSYHPDATRQYRECLFAEHLQAGGSLAEFHASHGESPSPYSPCMHREDARTVSFSKVEVTEGEATLDYSPGSPCQGLPFARMSLALLD
ncbi:MAG: NRDE family protein [Bryobacteraceae bacterium]|nr:NRDE family protein [Bryobacteraceae bacterium]